MNTKVKGILAILISAIGFSFMAAFFRLSGDLPVFQKSLARNFVAMFIPLFFILKYKQPFFGKLSSQPLLVTRSVLGLMGVLLNIYAIDHMVLSDADILMKLNPFWTILLSLIFLKEFIQKYQITSMVIAIIGMLFVVKPEFSSDVIPAIVGLLSGVFAASAYTAVRALSTREAPYTIVFYFSFFSVIVLIPFVAFTFEPMSLIQIVYLILAGLSAAVGQIGITVAYSYAPAKDISIFTYASIIFTAIIGFILFNESPDFYAIIGYIIILSASYYMFEKARRSTSSKHRQQPSK
ncbi:DMT family transporter [Staphylococcus pseudintermedius]|uniref:DMT family transporter n=1 Tax=Staphylococcus pseudintermedius TaxID=283734 RepID=UPI000D72D7CF|nr:DMT family transporter [Staphylococcus pseudintermedius]EGQ0291546.1 DMT family transporter [Staphylococcus pseudintermedius]EGQ0321182.1 DMT family transporter [Staphylococcus pseudintermedius]EGQ0374068.1 DMT family transporter [Staphylococcus pseudintermedius]EGQ0377037.1 DMT family transporter [Staphylococcus pseudintermedius]EGQ0399284.1 DMT family transporter [Staphylococcus pseudintermedius]